ncbi:hypothetical protein CBR_g12017 [Chara braunii]|uniref:Uncharacterized protein n=1 Tax=Chara braunii TaxID=69332 RepID=A0A388KQU2_CHABU|nr:hypothetical protein CBR_g12017 [Chara braunii]|eukprot:GBG72441.1 hypothetical protein CBR_g12017 [Chara braunii]
MCCWLEATVVCDCNGCDEKRTATGSYGLCSSKADVSWAFPPLKVGGVIILMEYQRSARSEARKERERQMETEHLKQRDAQLAIEIHMLKQRLEELEKGGGRKWLPSILSIGGSGTDREQQPAPTPQSQQEVVQQYLPDLPVEASPAAK